MAIVKLGANGVGDGTRGPEVKRLCSIGPSAAKYSLARSERVGSRPARQPP